MSYRKVQSRQHIVRPTFIMLENNQPATSEQIPETFYLFIFFTIAGRRSFWIILMCAFRFEPNSIVKTKYKSQWWYSIFRSSVGKTLWLHASSVQSVCQWVSQCVKFLVSTFCLFISGVHMGFICGIPMPYDKFTTYTT